MTEKYILIDGGVKDTVNGITWDSFLELVIVLNGQSRHLQRLTDENEQLKQSISDWKGSYDGLYEDVTRLEKENEQLKKELFEARKDYLIETADISDKLYLDEMIEKERKEIFYG